MDTWWDLAYCLGEDHDEKPEDKRTTLEDKLVGGNETVSWYDRKEVWEGKQKITEKRDKLYHYPYRDKMRRQWQERCTHTKYTEMLARLSMCMGKADRMHKIRDTKNTPLSVSAQTRAPCKLPRLFPLLVLCGTPKAPPKGGGLCKGAR